MSCINRFWSFYPQNSVSISHSKWLKQCLEPSTLAQIFHKKPLDNRLPPNPSQNCPHLLPKKIESCSPSFQTLFFKWALKSWYSKNGRGFSKRKVNSHNLLTLCKTTFSILQSKKSPDCHLFNRASKVEASDLFEAKKLKFIWHDHFLCN